MTFVFPPDKDGSVYVVESEHVRLLVASRRGADAPDWSVTISFVGDPATIKDLEIRGYTEEQATDTVKEYSEEVNSGK